MNPHLTVLPPGVDDLDRALCFCRDGLGRATKGIAHDSGLPEGPKSATEVTLGHNVSTRAEVEIVLVRAERAGARIVKHARTTF